MGEREPTATLSGDDAEETQQPEPVAPRRRRPRWSLIIAAALLAALLAWLIWPSSDPSSAQSPVGTVNTAEVVRTDLEAATTYSATLGRVDGDPISTSLAGTVTAAAEPGTLVEEGDVLFEIDGEPVVSLYGNTPMHRVIAAGEDVATITGQTSGTLTGTAAVGDLVEQGEALYTVDEVPTTLLYGDTPMWRELSSDVDYGPDVEQLEQALVDLGYDPDESVTVDEELTWQTVSMVKRWQDDIGIDDDGVVSPGEVVFMPGPVEIRSIQTEVGQLVADATPLLEVGNGVAPTGPDVEQLEEALTRLGHAGGGDMEVDGVYDGATHRAVLSWQRATGAGADGIVGAGEVVFAPSAVRISDQLVSVGSMVTEGMEVLAVTGSDIVVTLQLPAGDQELVAVGDPVGIELPDGAHADGTVEAVAGVATIGEEDEAVFEVTITLDDASLANGLDEAPVDVDIVTDAVQDALAVPVTALVVLAEGGYAVVVVDGGLATRLEAVEPGFYADGMVEVASESLDAGTEVVIP